MKPRAIYSVRSDGKHMICVSCPDKLEAEKYCDENRKDFSHGVCANCVNFIPADGEVFPKAESKTEKEHRPAGFLQRHNIHTEQDMERFLNGEQ